MTATAGNDRVNGNPLTRHEPGDASAGRHHHAGEFVSEDQRRSRSGQRVRRGGRDEHGPAQPFLKIGTADTAPPHPELQPARPGRRGRRHLLHSHVTSGMPPYGQHLASPSGCERTGNLHDAAQLI
jgi:hypothetical protein